MTTDCYNTIVSSAVCEVRERSSRFIAYSFSVTSPEQVAQIVARIRAEHHSARHHCYAWRIGVSGEQNRAVDDREPSGTAGRPILGQLVAANLSDVLVVVVRYFGGILLGTSGLIAAYRAAAKAVIERSEVCEKVLTQWIEIRVDYAELERVMRVIRRRDLNFQPIEYLQDNVVVRIEVRLKQIEQIQFELTPPQ